MNRRPLMRRIRNFLVHDVLHADDPPHRLALGIAIGMFVAFSPTFGVQMALVVLLAWLLKANKLVGTPVVWITNPATAMPIYYACYLVGVALTGAERVGRPWWHDLTHPPDGWWIATCFYWSKFMEIATPLTIGCTLIGVLLACPTYFIAYYVIRFHRLRRWGQLMPPLDARSPRDETNVTG